MAGMHLIMLYGVQTLAHLTQLAPCVVPERAHLGHARKAECPTAPDIAMNGKSATNLLITGQWLTSFFEWLQ